MRKIRGGRTELIRCEGGLPTRNSRDAMINGMCASVRLAMIWVLVGLGTGCTAGQDGGWILEPTPDRNVLLITVDTLRADALGVYGGAAATPHLDTLARSGALFTSAHAHAVVTLPSHTSLLTGQYPFEHGVRDNTGYRVADQARTLAERLQARGVATGAFVGAFPLNRRFGLDQGFDVYDDRLPETTSAVDFALPERRADAVVTEALDWIERQSGPWFGWVHVFDPHAPYRAPEPFLSTYASDPYAGEVAWTDAALGPLLAALDGAGRPTLVIVTADHGESLGEHGELTHGIFAYESTLRVPLIVAEVRPGATPPTRGVQRSGQARHVDVVPTVLDALGLEPDPSLPGGSLLPLIAADDADPRPAYFEAMTPFLSRGWAPLRGVLVGRDKYIDLPIEERYALDIDPQEQHNLAAADRSRTDTLAAILRSFDVAPPARPGAEPDDVVARLRALGYVSAGSTSDRTSHTEDDDPKRLVDLDRQLHEAGEAYARGRRDEAVAGFQRVIARRPDLAEAYRHLAYVYWHSGRAREAISTLEQALARGLTQREIQIKLGLYLAETGQAARAIPLLEGLPAPDNEALNALGIAYGQAGRLVDARRSFERALEFDDSSGLTLQNLATVQLRAGDLQGAEATFRRALAIDDRLAGAHTGLGVVLARRGRLPNAFAAWRRAVAIDPPDLNALFNLTVELFAAGQVDEARRHGERFVRIAPPALFAEDIARIRALLAGGRL